MTALNIQAAPISAPKAASCHHGSKPYLPYFAVATFIMMAAGVGWGSALLLKMMMAGQYVGLSVHEINAHGHMMLTGFLQLFIIGFAYQAFPRLLGHSLVKPQWCKPVLGMYIVGLLASVIGQLLNDHSWAAALVLAGDSLELVATLAFCGQMLVTFRLGGQRLEPHLLFIACAMTFMAVSSGFSAWLNYATLTAGSRMEVVYYVSTFQPSLRYLQLHGITMLMILGVGHRLLTNFFAFPRTSNRWMYISLATLVASILAETVLFMAYRLTGDMNFAKLLLVPWTGLLVGSILVIGRWRLWRQPRDTQGRTDRMGPFVQSSFAWLVVALLMTIVQPFWSHGIGVYFSHAFYGATRQAFAVGFATMMIIAFTLRVVPTLNSIVPTRLKPMKLCLWSINLGCLIHVTVQVVSDVAPGVLVLAPVAAALQFVGLSQWACHLAWCVLEGRRSDLPVSAPSAARLPVLRSA